MKGLATAVILLLTAVNYLGVRFGGVVQNIFSVAKMAAMVGLRFPTHSSRTRKNRLAPNGAVTVCSNPRPGVLGSAVQAGPARSSLNSTV